MKSTQQPFIQIDPDEIKLGPSLGEGSSGIVYQATWRYQNVAVKELFIKTLDPNTEKEFKNEVEIMARLRSPNTLDFYGYCVNPCRIVMEYMPKGSLYKVLHDPQESLSWDLRIKIAIDMSSGLAFLHCQDILHRDIKSLNVLLTQNYKAKLSDFGLASQSKSTLSTMKRAVGSLAWIAPELVTAEGGCTKSSDVYSLGITLWELASRALPFKDAARPELIPLKAAQGLRDKIPEDCPPKLATLIRACWDTEPMLRPSAEEAAHFMHDRVIEDFNVFLPRFRAGSLKSPRQDFSSEFRIMPEATAPSMPAEVFEQIRFSMESKQEDIKALEQTARAGNVGACERVGECYYKGEGVEKDVNKGVKWWCVGSDFGNIACKLRLAKHYEEQTDYSSALAMWRDIVQSGHKEHKFNIDRLKYKIHDGGKFNCFKR